MRAHPGPESGEAARKKTGPEHSLRALPWEGDCLCAEEVDAERPGCHGNRVSSRIFFAGGRRAQEPAGWLGRTRATLSQTKSRAITTHSANGMLSERAFAGTIRMKPWAVWAESRLAESLAT